MLAAVDFVSAPKETPPLRPSMAKPEALGADLTGAQRGAAGDGLKAAFRFVFSPCFILLIFILLCFSPGLG